MEKADMIKLIIVAIVFLIIGYYFYRESFDSTNNTMVNLFNTDNTINNSIDNTINNSMDNSMDNTINNSMDNSMVNTINNSMINTMDNSMDNIMDNSMDNSIVNTMDNTMDNTMNNSIVNTMVNSMDNLFNYSSSKPSGSIIINNNSDSIIIDKNSINNHYYLFDCNNLQVIFNDNLIISVICIGPNNSNNQNNNIITHQMPTVFTSYYNKVQQNSIYTITVTNDNNPITHFEGNILSSDNTNYNFNLTRPDIQFQTTNRTIKEDTYHLKLNQIQTIQAQTIEIGLASPLQNIIGLDENNNPTLSLNYSKTKDQSKKYFWDGSVNNPGCVVIIIHDTF